MIASIEAEKPSLKVGTSILWGWDLNYQKVEKPTELGGGGARLSSQHSGGRGRRISEFEASLVYRVSSRAARAAQKDSVLKNQPNKQINKQKANKRPNNNNKINL